METEVWKNIPGYELIYQVSTLGRIRNNKKNNKILKGSLDKDGYVVYGIGGKTQKGHRLVIKTFLGASNLQVNHINGIKNDNRLINLEYCTNGENQRHKYLILNCVSYFRENNPNKGKFGKLHHGSKLIKQITKDNVFIRNWDSIVDASNYIGKNSCVISNCLNGRQKTAGGFIWKYL